MFPPNSLELELVGNYVEIRMKSPFVDEYRNAHDWLTVDDNGVMSFRVDVPCPAVAHNMVTLRSWYPEELRGTGMTSEGAEWFTIWRKRESPKWDGKNPIVKMMRKLRKSRVGIPTRQRVEKNKPLLKHKWK